MASTISEFAATVANELKLRKRASPRRSVLEAVLNVAFFCTLDKDEGEPIRFDLTYLDPLNPDPDPPFYVRSDRWVVVPFAESLPFTRASIAKVALASDHRTSMLLVFPDHDTGELRIWGFVDQGTNTHKLRTNESEEGFEPPGAFQVSAVDAGHLIVRAGFLQIAELRGNDLTAAPADVFGESPIMAALEPTVDLLSNPSRKFVQKNGGMTVDPDELAFAVDHRIGHSLRRLLLRVQGYGHGGAILITPNLRGSRLNIKHRINYSRLGQSITKYALRETHGSDLYWEIFGGEHRLSDVIPRILHLDYTINNDEFDDAKDELDGTLWFISLLSRIDGLVLLDRTLTVRGFGVEIAVRKQPQQIWEAHDAAGTKRTPLAYDHFGTRHRSMMRYIAAVPGSVGFVVSQDRGVRAMTLVDGDVLFWKNVQLLADFGTRGSSQAEPPETP